MNNPPTAEPAACRITLTPNAEDFLCRQDESLLNGMHRTGRKGIPVGCRGGGCGVCRVRIAAGKFVARSMSRDHISETNQQDGEVLACRVFPRCDLQVDVIGPLRRRLVRDRD